MLAGLQLHGQDMLQGGAGCGGGAAAAGDDTLGQGRVSHLQGLGLQKVVGTVKVGAALLAGKCGHTIRKTRGRVGVQGAGRMRRRDGAAVQDGQQQGGVSTGA